MLVKCPYCEIKSPIEEWIFKIDRLFVINFKGIKENSHTFDYAKCPICLEEVGVDLGAYMNSQRINLEDVKNQIESYHIDVENKVFYCKNCGSWRNLCDIQLVGKSKSGNKEIIDIDDVFIGNIKLNSFLLEKVKCLCCKTEIPIEPFEIKFSLNEDELTKIFKVLNEKTKEALRQEGRIEWNI